MAKIPRVCLIGPESTAKTTLAGQLADRWSGAWVPEFARQYALARGGELTLADVEEIARGHMEHEDLALAAKPRILFLDTDLISTVVYSRHYYGTVADWIVEEARRRLADLYLLMDIDLPWEADPARDRGHRRAELFREFEAALREFGATYRIVRGRDGGRVEIAIRIVSAFMGTRNVEC